MAAAHDFYQVLGLSRDAGPDEIRKAYRRLARQYHPDTNNGDAEATARFKELNAAYEVLSDPEKKARYDRFGQAGIEGGAPGGEAGFGGFGGFTDIFDVFFGSGTRASPAERGPERGGDRRVDVEITLREVLTGVEKNVPVTRLERCGDCSGSGARSGTRPEKCVACAGRGFIPSSRQTFFGTVSQMAECYRCHGLGEIIRDPCGRCGGQGVERRTRTLEVKIPPGVDERSWIRRTGEGDAGMRGGPPGDLAIFIQIRKDPVFQRRGQDLFSSVEVSFARAGLGGRVRVPTIEGDEVYEIPPGTQPGETFTIPGKGLPDHRRPAARGDQHVTIRVRTPVNLNERQRRLLEELAAASGEDLEDVESPRSQDGGFLKWVRNLFTPREEEDEQ